MKKRWLKAGLAAILVVLVPGCPMPFQYSQTGVVGQCERQ